MARAQQTLYKARSKAPSRACKAPHKSGGATRVLGAAPVVRPYQEHASHLTRVEELQLREKTRGKAVKATQKARGKSRGATRVPGAAAQGQTSILSLFL